MDHIVTAYDEELDALAADLSRLGGLAEAAIRRAVEAITRSDARLAETVIAGDSQLDHGESEIEHKAIRLIARRQPVAGDLRRTVAAMKIAANLERCGDLAKNIAKRALVIIEDGPAAPPTGSIERMGELVSARLKAVLDAQSTRRADNATAVWRADEEIDELYDAIFRELLTYMMADPRTITVSAHLLFVAKNLERIGDHATNIAEIVHYEITGVELDAPRPKADALAPASEA